MELSDIRRIPHSVEAEQSVIGSLLIDPSCINLIADKLTAHRAAIWSDFLTFIGVANIGLEKRERLTESESTANTAFYGISSELGLLTRREAAEELAAKTGLEISVTNRAEDAEMLHAFNLTLVENGVENRILPHVENVQKKISTVLVSV